LNVGGEHMAVTMANLVQVKDSTLEKMFRYQHAHGLLKYDSQGRIFLDRDPYFFSSLLNFLATNGEVEPNKGAFETEMFNKELQFWGIDKTRINW
jgi:hypothetical protein